MAKTKDYKPPTRAELEAMRESKLQGGWPDARQQAEHHESMLLKGIGSAQESFDWIVEHAAWTDLGFASVADWWTTRIRPVMIQLDVRPTPEMVDKVLAKVREAERALPPAQRRTQRELAELTLASDWKVRGRTDNRNRRSAAGGDLDERAGDPVETIPDEAKRLIQDRLDQQAAAGDANQPADGGQQGESFSGPSATVQLPAEGPSANTSDVADGPSVNPTEDHRGSTPGEADDDGGPSSPAPLAPAGVSDASGTTEPAGAAPPPAPQLAEEVEEQAPDGVPAPAPPHIPTWFNKVSAVVNAVNELLDENPAEVGAGIPYDWATALGDSLSGLAEWLGEMQDAIKKTDDDTP